jgi:hypothetical protein
METGSTARREGRRMGKVGRMEGENKGGTVARRRGV